MQPGARSKKWTFAHSIALLVLANGCVAEKCETDTGQEATCVEFLTRYEDDASVRTLTANYFPGTHLVVDGIYGEIRMFKGSVGRISARFAPFAYGSKDDETAAFERLRNVARMEILPGSPALTVRSDRTDDMLPVVGLDLEIGLPTDFDGHLVVTNHSAGAWNPGDVELDFVGAATSIELNAGKLSSCSINGSPSVFFTHVRCWSDITVAGVSDDVEIESEGQLGDLSLTLASISAQSLGGRVTAGGDIDVTFPASANLTIQAQAEAPGRVDTTAAPSSCSIAVAAETAKSLTCGMGDNVPNYLIDARGNVRLGFE